jgi:hypothetical protein
MLRLWLRIFCGVAMALVLQYAAATFLLGESDLDSYELAEVTLSNGFVYRELVADRGGMQDREALTTVLRDIQVPMCDLHVLEDLPFTAEKYYDITLDEDPDFDWEALCEAHDLLRLVLPEQPHVPPAFVFFAD